MAEAELSFEAFTEAEGDEQVFGVKTHRLCDLADSVDERVVSLDYDLGPRKLNFGVGPYHTRTRVSTRIQSVKSPLSRIWIWDSQQTRTSTCCGGLSSGSTNSRRTSEWATTARTTSFGWKRWSATVAGKCRLMMVFFELDRGDLDCVRDDGEADSHFSIDYLRTSSRQSLRVTR